MSSPPRHSPSPSPPKGKVDDGSESFRWKNASRRPQSRSPHPYHRLKSELTQPTLSPASWARLRSHTHSDSGTEADDENDALVNSAEGEGYVIRALPAPPFRPRKGLHPLSSSRARNERGTEEDEILQGEVFRLSDVGLDERMVDAVVGKRAKFKVEGALPEQEKDKERQELDDRRRKRRAEILRRVLEGAISGLLTLGVLSGRTGVWRRLHKSEKGQLACSSFSFIDISSRTHHAVSGSLRDICRLPPPTGVVLLEARSVIVVLEMHAHYGRIRSCTVHLSHSSASDCCLVSFSKQSDLLGAKSHS